MNKWGDKVLKLRAEDKSYSQIQAILGCCRSVVCYHCGEGQKQKTKIRQQERRKKLHPYIRKAESFRGRPSHIEHTKLQITSTIKKTIYAKTYNFCRISRGKKAMSLTFNFQDVVDKFGENPVCYLTGQPIDIHKPSSYHFDHIIPRSRGGTNELDNLGICTKAANFSKNDMAFDEFINFCETVVKNAKHPNR